MNLPNYNKKIEIVCREKDYYGFVEKEGEAYIKDGVLITNLRYNDRMTEEKGEYKLSTYPILEYFAEFNLLKVERSPHMPAIFDLNIGAFPSVWESLRLVKDNYDSSNMEELKNGLHFIAHHLCYLYKVEPNASLPMMDKIVHLEEEEELTINDFRVYKAQETYYIQQINHPFLMRVVVHENGIIFCYDYISYYFAGLKKYLGDSLQGTVWRIA